MTKSIFKCGKSQKYTLQDGNCPFCGGKTVSPQPARFSLEKEKKFSKYRRQLIKSQSQ